MKSFAVEVFNMKSGKNMYMKAQLNVVGADSTHARIRLMCWATIQQMAETDFVSWNNMAR